MEINYHLFFPMDNCKDFCQSYSFLTMSFSLTDISWTLSQSAAICIVLYVRRYLLTHKEHHVDTVSVKRWNILYIIISSSIRSYFTTKNAHKHVPKKCWLQPFVLIYDNEDLQPENALVFMSLSKSLYCMWCRWAVMLCLMKFMLLACMTMLYFQCITPWLKQSRTCPEDR